jgi:hypothetical protein
VYVYAENKEILMKKIFFCMVLIGSMFTACLTAGKKADEPIVYSEVVEMENLSKDTLYTKANMWFVDAFNNAESVIQFSDKESGIIKGKYIFPGIGYDFGYRVDVGSTITIEVRDNRYRISFADPDAYTINPNTGGRGMTCKSVPVALVDKIMTDWKGLASNLKAYVYSADSW